MDRGMRKIWEELGEKKGYDQHILYEINDNLKKKGNCNLTAQQQEKAASRPEPTAH